MPDQNPYFPSEDAPAAPQGKAVNEQSPPDPQQTKTLASAWSGAKDEGVKAEITPEVQTINPSPPPPPPTEPAVPVVAATPIPVSPADQSVPAATSAVSGDPSITQSPRRKFPIKIILGLFGVILLAVLGYFGFKFFSKKAPPPLQQNTITWWGLWEDTSIVSPLIEEFQQTNPNIKIDYVRQSSKDYRERLESSLSKGEGPDIFFYHNSWVPMFKDKLDKMPSTVMSAGDYAQTFYPVIASDATSGTGLVGIPLGYDGLTLFINQDIFDAAGKTPPQTWDELRKLASDLTVKDKEGIITQSGAALGLTENVDHWPEIMALMMLQNGVDLAKPSGELAQKALDFYTLFYKQDKVWDATLPPSTMAFAAGKVAMMFGPSWRAFDIKEQNPNLRFKAVALPHLPKDDPTKPDIAYATYWMQGVWYRSPNKEIAWNFLKFMSQKDTLEKLYANEAKVRLFGEPYPRADMADLINSHPIIGALISQAPSAQSWYLASRTFDGQTGINTQINKYFEDAINTVNKGTDSQKALETAAAGVAQVLAQFGVSSP